MIECTVRKKILLMMIATLGHALAHGRTDDAAYKFRTMNV
jgi:hypothetical protein